MTEQDLSFVADALLSLCDRSDDAPFYTEDIMRSKLKRAEIKDPKAGHCVLPRAESELFRRELNELFESAGLTERQYEVLLLRLDGWTFEEIGAKGGHSKQGAQNIFLQALKKLVRTFRVYRFRGLSDVYEQETHRGARYRPFGTMGAQPRS